MTAVQLLRAALRFLASIAAAVASIWVTFCRMTVAYADARAKTESRSAIHTTSSALPLLDAHEDMHSQASRQEYTFTPHPTTHANNSTFLQGNAPSLAARACSSNAAAASVAHCVASAPVQSVLHVKTDRVRDLAEVVDQSQSANQVQVVQRTGYNQQQSVRTGTVNELPAAGTVGDEQDQSDGEQNEWRPDAAVFCRQLQDEMRVLRGELASLQMHSTQSSRSSGPDAMLSGPVAPFECTQVGGVKSGRVRSDTLSSEPLLSQRASQLRPAANQRE